MIIAPTARRDVFDRLAELLRTLDDALATVGCYPLVTVGECA